MRTNLRRTVNTPGFEQPELEAVVKAERIAGTDANPRFAEAPPVMERYTLTQYDGPFALSANTSRDVRAVSDVDLNEIGDYLPHYQKRFPRATPEGLLPLLKLAVQGGPYKFIRTNNAFALFMWSQYPWEPLPIVYDVFVVWRDEHAAHEAVKLYRAGKNWAIELGAVEFRFAEDAGADLAPIAKRLGCDRVCKQYIRVLR